MSGLATLFSQGYWLIGTVVLLILARPALLRSQSHRALLYRGVEMLGRLEKNF